MGINIYNFKKNWKKRLAKRLVLGPTFFKTNLFVKKKLVWLVKRLVCADCLLSVGDNSSVGDKRIITWLVIWLVCADCSLSVVDNSSVGDERIITCGTQRICHSARRFYSEVGQGSWASLPLSPQHLPRRSCRIHVCP